MKKLFLVLAVCLASIAPAMASQSDIVASQNQVSLSYSHDRTGDGVTFKGMTATVGYLGDAVITNGYAEASVGMANANVDGFINVADRTLGLKAGVALPMAENLAVIPYASLRHETIDAGFASASGNTLAVGVKAMYAAAPGLVLNADLNVGHIYGHATGMVATASGKAVHLGVGADYAVTKMIHVSVDYTHGSFRVAGISVTDNVAMVGVGLAY